LWQEHGATPEIVEAREKAVALARDPQRRAKIAVSRRGKKLPTHVVEAMRNGRKGKPLSEATRAKMREAHRRRREALAAAQEQPAT
jgi:hypothetical protein